MAKTAFKTVDEYIRTFPKDVQASLEQIRQAIQKAVPAAEEVISYQIPAYKYHGWVFYFSAHKKHISLSCPPPSAAFQAYKEELSGYKQTKSAVQFPLDEPMPLELIHDMAKHQAQANLQKREVEPAKHKKARQAGKPGQDNFPNIAKPALRALNNAGYSKLEQLSDVSEQELLKLHGMGQKALSILKQALAEKGLTFKDK